MTGFSFRTMREMDALNYAQEYDRVTGERVRRQQSRAQPFPRHVTSNIRVSRAPAPSSVNTVNVGDLFEMKQKLSL